MSRSLRPWHGTLPTLGQRVYVDESAVVIGQVTLADDASVWPLTTVRGDVNSIHIGARSNVQDNSVLHVTHDGPYSPGGMPLVIGEDVTIGHGVILHACTIGDRCLIGMGSIVMDKAVIESDVLLAAGSMVPPGKLLKSGHLYRGSPAQLVRALEPKELENLLYSARHYVKIKDQYLAGAAG